MSWTDSEIDAWRGPCPGWGCLICDPPTPAPALGSGRAVAERRRRPRASRHYRCEVCEGPIWRGDRYLFLEWVSRGWGSKSRRCLDEEACEARQRIQASCQLQETT